MEIHAKDKPLVSVWCLTYNHASYIREALEGILCQKTDFSYKVIVHDDASTDGTTDILKEYEEKYPDKIKVIYEEENIFHKKNKSEIIYNIKKRELIGKYVAYCEGDDSWTNPNKLQKQVDYMEEHEECMMTLHNAEMIDFVEGTTKPMSTYASSGRLSPEQVIRQSNGMVPTASMVVRREIAFMKGFFLECGIGDYPLQLYAVSKGYVFYFNECMSKYRFMHAGSWSTAVRANKRNNIPHCIRMIIFLIKYNNYTDRRFERYLNHRLNIYIHHIAMAIRELSREDYNNVCKKIAEEHNHVFDDLIAEIRTIAMAISERNHVSKQLENFCEKNKNIVIWGTGVYAEDCTRQLSNMGVEVQGYVVTTKEDGNDFFYGKKVWEINEFPYEPDQVGVIVAVSVYLWDSIKETIQEHGIQNYYYPFTFDMNGRKLL